MSHPYPSDGREEAGRLLRERGTSLRESASLAPSGSEPMMSRKNSMTRRHALMACCRESSSPAWAQSSSAGAEPMTR